MKKAFFLSVIVGLFFSLVQDRNLVFAQEKEESIRSVTATRVQYDNWKWLSYYGNIRVGSSQEVIDQFVHKEAVLKVEVDNGIDPYVSFQVPIEIEWNYDEVDFTKAFWYVMSGKPIVPESVYCEELNANVVLFAPEEEIVYRIQVIDAMAPMDIFVDVEESKLLVNAYRISNATGLFLEYSMDGGKTFTPWMDEAVPQNLLEGIEDTHKKNAHTFEKEIVKTESPFKEYEANEIDCITFRLKVEGGTYDGYSDSYNWPLIDERPDIPEDETSGGGRNDDGDNPTGNIPQSEPEPTIAPTVTPVTRPVPKPRPQVPEKKTWDLNESAMPLWFHFSLDDSEMCYQEIQHLMKFLRKILYR